MTEMIDYDCDLMLTLYCRALQHGESDMNDCGRIGGDGDLSAHGQEVC